MQIKGDLFQDDLTPLCFFLQSGELDLPLVPPMRAENLYMVPQGIRPVVQLTAVEVTPCFLSV